MKSRHGQAGGIKGLREASFGILVKDASLGGGYLVMNVTLLHPQDQAASPASAPIRASRSPWSAP